MRPDNDKDTGRPILNVVGERVALGPVRDEHFEDLTRWENDFGTERFFGVPGPRRTEDTRRKFTEGLFSDAASVVFALYEIESRRFIGLAGLFDVDHTNRTAEYFVKIGPGEIRGKGYGTETTRLVLDHAFTALGLASVRLAVFSYNLAAIRSYEKAGFRHVGTLRRNKMMGGRLWDTVMMDTVAEEFESPILRDILMPDE